MASSILADLDWGPGLTTEKDLCDFYNNADLGLDIVVWVAKPKGNTSHTEHKLSFVDTLLRAANRISQREGIVPSTKKGLLIVGVEGANVVESQPGFCPRQNLTGVELPEHFRGILNGRWEVFFAPSYPSSDFVVVGGNRLALRGLIHGAA